MMDSLGLELRTYHRKRIGVASVRVHIPSLSYIGLHIDEHLSLGLLLFSLNSCLFLVYSPASLVKLFIGLRGLTFKIVLILIVIFNLDASVVAGLPYVMEL